MERKVSELDGQIVLRFEFLDTPGDEIAPGSDKIGKHLKNQRLGHKHLHLFDAIRVCLILGPLLIRSQSLGTLYQLDLVRSRIRNLSFVGNRKRR